MKCPNCTANMVRDKMIAKDTGSSYVCTNVRSCRFGHLLSDCPCRLC